MQYPAVALGPPRHETCNPERWRDDCVRAFQSASGAFGVGAMPIGLKMHLLPSGAVRVFGSVSIGLIQFDRRMPSPEARSTNFSGDYAVGVEVPVGGGSHVVSVGWKFLHWSNAGTAPSNPGVDANLLSLSIKRRLRHP